MHFARLPTLLFPLSLSTALTSALPALEASTIASAAAATPSVQLKYAKVIGSSTSNIDTFQGIPYAQPPTGTLRLKPPQPITTPQGTITATNIPATCPQLAGGGMEDCLTINIQRPSAVISKSKLPVLFWIYGGAFSSGSTSEFDGTQLITNAVSKGQPIIFVALNYRLGAFGFLAGAEVVKDGSANLGLLDQRLGLQWVADNIASFGGDPDKVTIWGESAGAMSVFNQMALYGGKYTYKNKPLFRGGIMNSGSMYASQEANSSLAQAAYDTIVAKCGCANSTDTLSCLRGVPYSTFLAASNSFPSAGSYSSVALPFIPRSDGIVLPLPPDALSKTGQVAPVPFIIGDQEDEGTLFSSAQTNLSTTAELVTYFSTVIWENSTASQVSSLIATYPDNPSDGSPFGTGTANNIYTQYKRVSAIIGDTSFTLVRRCFLSNTLAKNPKVKSWSYLATYNFGTAILGTAHASDVAVVFGLKLGFPQESIQSYYLNFVYNLDPNKGTTNASLIQWPTWGTESQLLNFGATNNTLMIDDFRSSSYTVIQSFVSSFRV